MDEMPYMRCIGTWCLLRLRCAYYVKAARPDEQLIFPEQTGKRCKYYYPADDDRESKPWGVGPEPTT